MGTDGTILPVDGLLAAFRVVLRPLARLAVAAGVPYGRIDEVVRQVLVEAASAAHSALPSQRRVSRISTTLGLNRREVTRLHRAEDPQPAAAPSHATRLFLKWQSDSRFRDASGALLLLARQGPGLTFEQLAQEVTRDVHPRSLLEELCRLGLARHDEQQDTVELIVEAFVPRGDSSRMLGFLAANVGDHFDAAVTNVLGDGREHFEQAIFADELSRESVGAFRETITRQWQALRQAAVPVLEALIEGDRRAGRMQDQRLRLGLFSWSSSMQSGPLQAPKAGAGEPPGAAVANVAAGAAESGTAQEPLTAPPAARTLEGDVSGAAATEGERRAPGKRSGPAAKPKSPAGRGSNPPTKDAGSK